MIKQVADALALALQHKGVDASPIEDLNIWCVRIRHQERNWCSLVGNNDELTWGPMWEFHIKHHGDVDRAVKAIMKTLPRKRRIAEEVH